MVVDGVELPALDWVREDVGGFLDALEEGIVLVSTLGGALVRVVLEDLLAVGSLDLLFGGFPPVFGEAEDGVVVLILR